MAGIHPSTNAGERKGCQWRTAIAQPITQNDTLQEEGIREIEELTQFSASGYNDFCSVLKSFEYPFTQLHLLTNINFTFGVSPNF